MDSNILKRPFQPKEVSYVIVEKKHHVLDADETEKVRALLQEYDLSSGAKEERGIPCVDHGTT